MTSLLTIVAAVGNNSETKLDIQPLTSDWQQVTVWERLSASLGFRETQSCVVCIAIRNNFTLTNDRVYKWFALKEGSTFKTVCWKMKPRGSETNKQSLRCASVPKTYSVYYMKTGSRRLRCFPVLWDGWLGLWGQLCRQQSCSLWWH